MHFTGWTDTSFSSVMTSLAADVKCSPQLLLVVISLLILGRLVYPYIIMEVNLDPGYSPAKHRLIRQLYDYHKLTTETFNMKGSKSKWDKHCVPVLCAYVYLKYCKHHYHIVSIDSKMEPQPTFGRIYYVCGWTQTFCVLFNILN